ncbi:hypothetical protein [Aquimarina sp. AU474]|uniref:hypothetical protein n=1 Tax=Aquimarina sp. AU474 TaxID=2108529 RepID=UPI000D696477|nr:hypothetical protein [Aquimarina sp. AU474]
MTKTIGVSVDFEKIEKLICVNDYDVIIDIFDTEDIHVNIKTMEACKITYTCNKQVSQKSKLNRILIQVFTNYVNAMSTLLFIDSANCCSRESIKGIMIHK